MYICDHTPNLSFKSFIFPIFSYDLVFIHIQAIYECFALLQSQWNSMFALLKMFQFYYLS